MSPPTSFTRDRFTWLAYLALAYFAYVQATLGPLMPFLRDELGMSYTVSDPSKRRWPRGVDEVTAANVRSGQGGGPGSQSRPLP